MFFLEEHASTSYVKTCALLIGWLWPSCLTSPLYVQGDGWRCLLFYYSMYGQDMGSLSVRVRHLNGTEHLLWSRSGNQGDVWFLEKVDFQAPKYYKVKSLAKFA